MGIGNQAQVLSRQNVLLMAEAISSDPLSNFLSQTCLKIMNIVLPNLHSNFIFSVLFYLAMYLSTWNPVGINE